MKSIVHTRKATLNLRDLSKGLKINLVIDDPKAYITFDW